MATLDQQRMQKYIAARQQHPAWLLLASRRAPLMLRGLDALFEHQRDGVPFEVAAQAQHELRDWIRRGLVTEREVRLHPTECARVPPNPSSRRSPPTP